jgi:hypothetical protein
MRARRTIVAGLVAGAVLAVPRPAAADGGAYIDFGGTHYLPGETATGVGYVSIPAKQQDLLDRGPFYVYVVPPRAWIETGKPLPHGVIRVDTASIRPEGKTVFEIRTSFAVPQVSAGDYYTVQVCNSPCTIAGFTEPLSGSISIVQTAREAQLLDENQKLYGKSWSLRRQVRKAEKANAELTSELATARDSAATAGADVERLRAQVASATPASGAPSADESRPIVDAWALVAIVGALIVALTAIALGLGFGRRSAGRPAIGGPAAADPAPSVPAARDRTPVG